MPAEVGRQKVQQLVAQGAQVVEVLGAKEYNRAHLPGAINIALQKLDETTASRLRKDRPVIVYCYDYQ